MASDVAMQGLVADAREILCDHGVVNLMEKNILEPDELGMVTELFSSTRQMLPSAMLGSAGKSPIATPGVLQPRGPAPSVMPTRAQVANSSTPSPGRPACGLVSPDTPMTPTVGAHQERETAISRADVVPMDQSLQGRLQGYGNGHPGGVAPLPAGNHQHVARPPRGHLQGSLPVGVQQGCGAAGLARAPSPPGPHHVSIQGVASRQAQSGPIHSGQMQPVGPSAGQASGAAPQSYLQAIQYGVGAGGYGLGPRTQGASGTELGKQMLSVPVTGDAAQKQLRAGPGTLQAQLPNNLQALHNQAEAHLAQQHSDYQALIGDQQKQQQPGTNGLYAGQAAGGARGLILAQPSVLPGQGTTAPTSRSSSVNGMPLTGEGRFSRAAARQLHTASHGGGAATGSSNSATDQNGHSPDSKHDAALNSALETLRYTLNEDGNLSAATCEKIVQELSGIESLQSMLLFRPNKKKGKGGRQPAKDPRLDPNVDPRKAKRIVANRQSAARSKQKQKQHLETLQRQHDTLTIQNLLCGREMEKLEKANSTLEKDTKVLDLEIQALTEHVTRVDSLTMYLVQERDRLRTQTHIPPYMARG